VSPETISVLAVGIGLAGLMVGLFVWLRQDMWRIDERATERTSQLETRTNQRFDQLEARTNERFDQMGQRIDRLETQTNEKFERLETRLAALDRGQAKLEGLLEGLREAIAGRRAAS